MAIRSFRTGAGVVWQVWNVMPGRLDNVERRIGYDRRSPEPVIRYIGPERRTIPDRRQPPPFLSAHLAAGWLTFECPTEKRRLAPIPQHWERLTDAELERLCDAARPVPAPSLPPRDQPPS
jgi:hypothetical protein